MRYAFFGTSTFSVAILEKLLSEFYRPEFVVTQPDKPVGRRTILTPPPVKNVSQDHELICYQPQKPIELLDLIQKAELDCLVVASYGHIIPQKILDASRIGAINVHTSLLPAYRGASPIQAAILNGDEETGISIMLMDAKMDHGPVYFQSPVSLSEKETSPSLSSKLAHTAAEVLAKVLPDIVAGKMEAEDQDHEEATFVSIIKKEDARIDWNQSAAEIERMVRAFTPWPNAWTELEDGKRLKILSSSVLPYDGDAKPGTLLIHKKNAIVVTGQGALQLDSVQVEGKNQPLDSTAFAAGYQRLHEASLV